MDKVIKWLGIGLLILSVLSFFICLITENSYIKFFYIPFKDILNIAIVVLAVYYFVEYKNDKRATKKYLESLCNQIIKRVENPRMYIIKNEKDIMYVRVQQRIIFNEIDLSMKKADDFQYEDDIKYCKEKFDEYWEFISDNITDIKMITRLEPQIHDRLAKLVNRCETISLKLYE